MILVDSNVPMYLIGAAHPHKVDAQRILETLVSARERLVSDVEVMQELLHRYTAINRRDAIQPAFDVLMALVDEILPITREIAERAKEVVMARPALSARDALHVAVMAHHGIDSILSFDTGFDSVPGLTRLA